jgi:hypothetical protein
MGIPKHAAFYPFLGPSWVYGICRVWDKLIIGTPHRRTASTVDWYILV